MVRPPRAWMSLCSAILGLCLYAYAAPAWSADRTLKFGYVVMPGSAYERSIGAIPDIVRAATDGALSIELVPLENSREAVDRLAGDSIQIAALFPASSELRGLDLAAVPGVLDDLDAYRLAMQELLRPVFELSADKLGLRFLATGALSGLAIFTDASVSAKGGLNGSRIGVGSPAYAAMIAAVNTQVVILRTREMFTALQTRSLDGALIRTWRAERLRIPEIAKTAVDWPYGRLTPWVVVADAARWAELARPQREAAEKALQELEAAAFAAAREEEFSVRAQLRDQGIAFAGLSVDQLRGEPVLVALRSVQDAWIKRTPDPEMYKALIVEASVYGTGGGGCPDHFERCGDRGCQVTCE
ncbi:MAG: hypothetical protein GY791_08305 [Alphaproteobacteria bacterium]|nr:hypothetical protein [Alphaproteobacteria bacterium]